MVNPSNQSGRALRYAGFFRRAWATFIDVGVLLTVVAAQEPFLRLSPLVAFATYVLSNLLVVGYAVYFHGRWGQTLGKMAAKIKVTRLDGRQISLSQALLRSSVDIALSGVWTIGAGYTLLTWTGPEWSSLGYFERGSAFAETLPLGFRAVDLIYDVWFWSELVVMLTNGKRRALHDFIAGTVVVERGERPSVSRLVYKLRGRI